MALRWLRCYPPFRRMQNPRERPVSWSITMLTDVTVPTGKTRCECPLRLRETTSCRHRLFVTSNPQQKTVGPTNESPGQHAGPIAAWLFSDRQGRTEGIMRSLKSRVNRAGRVKMNFFAAPFERSIDPKRSCEVDVCIASQHSFQENAGPTNGVKQKFRRWLSVRQSRLVIRFAGHFRHNLAVHNLARLIQYKDASRQQFQFVNHHSKASPKAPL